MPVGALCDDARMPPTVLIVDDHPTFRATAHALLEAEGFGVVGEAATGLEAPSPPPRASSRPRPARRSAARYRRVRGREPAGRKRRAGDRAGLEPRRRRLRRPDPRLRGAWVRAQGRAVRRGDSRAPRLSRNWLLIAVAVAVAEAAAAVATRPHEQPRRPQARHDRPAPDHRDVVHRERPDRAPAPAAQPHRHLPRGRRVPVVLRRPVGGEHERRLHGRCAAQQPRVHPVRAARARLPDGRPDRRAQTGSSCARRWCSSCSARFSSSSSTSAPRRAATSPATASAIVVYDSHALAEAANVLVAVAGIGLLASVVVLLIRRWRARHDGRPAPPPARLRRQRRGAARAAVRQPALADLRRRGPPLRAGLPGAVRRWSRSRSCSASSGAGSRAAPSPRSSSRSGKGSRCARRSPARSAIPRSSSRTGSSDAAASSTARAIASSCPSRARSRCDDRRARRPAGGRARARRVARGGAGADPQRRGGGRARARQRAAADRAARSVRHPHDDRRHRAEPARQRRRHRQDRRPQSRDPSRERLPGCGLGARPLLLGRLHRPGRAGRDARALRRRGARVPALRVRERVHQPTR